MTGVTDVNRGNDTGAITAGLQNGQTPANFGTPPIRPERAEFGLYGGCKLTGGYLPGRRPNII
ncbi:hypothetical protein UI24_07315 [Mycobacteroides franklinii]|nr:hypothetical protein [Mycobacteroides franklinii]